MLKNVDGNIVRCINDGIVHSKSSDYVEKTIESIIKDEIVDFRGNLDFMSALNTMFSPEEYAKSKITYEGQHVLYLAYYAFVNLRKIWVPLCDFLKNNILEEYIYVADIGCGPGTVSIGFIEFYEILCGFYPKIKFKICIDLYDREAKFIEYARKLLDSCISRLPQNLTVVYRAHVVNFENGMKLNNIVRYDLLIMSNFINECVCEIHDIVRDVISSVEDDGKIIIIEPGTRDSSNLLTSIYSNNSLLLQEIFPCYNPKFICGEWNFRRIYWDSLPSLLSLIGGNDSLRFVKRNNVPFTYKILMKKEYRSKELGIGNSFRKINLCIGSRIDVKVKICGLVSKFSPMEEDICLRLCGRVFNYSGGCVFLKIVKEHFLSLFGDRKLTGCESLDMKNVLVVTDKYGKLELCADNKSTIDIIF